ncbi:PAS domain-containing protein [Oceanibaculum pacificum]|uniref:PAS domain-containing protein n=1 Tax=Oceanibaculum pacificum TaxID=580166 RepID=UPI0018DD5BD9|nr:PAS domain-containing protein [Oceanibaculum pacificum]
MADATSTPPSEILLAVWRRQRQIKGRLPDRQDIDPLDLGKQVLPRIAIVELVPGGRLRFRLCGSELARFAGLDLTGCFVDELNPNKDYADYITDLYMLARRTRLPVLSSCQFRGSHDLAQGTTTRLICPLAYDGENVDHFFTVQSFGQTSGIPGTVTMTYAEGFQPGLTRVIEDGEAL